ncbi:MAG: phospholipase D-like domain-containing protein [Yoonia sp.]
MNWLMAHLEIVVITLFALIAALVILQQRRTPQSTAAWLLFIILVPYLAIPLFLALGFRKRGNRFKPIVFENLTSQHSPGYPARMAAISEAYQFPEATMGNKLRLLETGEAAFTTLLDVCRSATATLDVLFYIVANDPVGKAFLSELTTKAKSGVRVRLIMDRLGNMNPPRTSLAALKAAGGEVRYFSPLLQMPDSGHLNLRNHRKMLIADGARIFAGGMNVGTEYMGPHQSMTRWTDLAYHLEGPAAQSFCDIFLSDWVTAGGTIEPMECTVDHKSAGTSVVQLVPSGPDAIEDPLHDALVHAIHAATERVWIVTPYFLPTDFLGNALRIAAKRSLDVRILVPRKSNQYLADFARGAYLREMQDAGAIIQFFESGMIHAKVGIIDEMAYVGSANFDIRSMLLNFETALFAYDADSVRAIADWYKRQESHCTESMKPAGHLRRILEGVFRLGAPVL